MHVLGIPADVGLVHLDGSRDLLERPRLAASLVVCWPIERSRGRTAAAGLQGSLLRYHNSVGTNREQAAADEFDRLVHDADHSLDSLIREYEWLETVYREATTSEDVVTQVVNTTSLPRALITTVTSAR